MAKAAPVPSASAAPQSIADNPATLGHVVVDASGAVVHADEQLTALLGLEKGKRGLAGCMDGDAWSQVQDAVREAAHAPFSSAVFDVLLRVSGEDQWAHVRLAPGDKEGLATLIVEQAEPVDPAAELQAQSWRRELLQWAEADQRDPVTPLLEGLAALRRGQWGPVGVELRERVSGLEVFARRMEVLLDEVRCAAAVARGEFVVRPEHVDLRAVVHAACAVFRDAADDAGIEFHVRAQTPMPCHVDRGRILHVLETLLENAIRLTPPDHAVHVEARPSDAGYLVSVADEGVGLNSSQQNAIWEPFASVHGGPGVGLGLFVAKHAVEAHGGNLHVDSNPGQGSKFTLTLPP